MDWFDPQTVQLIKDLGIPLLVAFGLFGLFLSLGRKMMNRHFDEIDESNKERKDTTQKFTDFLENTVKDVTLRMEKVGTSLDRTSEMLRELQDSNTKEHSVILERQHEANVQLSELRGGTNAASTQPETGD